VKLPTKSIKYPFFGLLPSANVLMLSLSRGSNVTLPHVPETYNTDGETSGPTDLPLARKTERNAGATAVVRNYVASTPSGRPTRRGNLSIRA
jgi:hypothetical protein